MFVIFIPTKIIAATLLTFYIYFRDRSKSLVYPVTFTEVNLSMFNTPLTVFSLSEIPSFRPHFKGFDVPSA